MSRIKFIIGILGLLLPVFASGERLALPSRPALTASVGMDVLQSCITEMESKELKVAIVVLGTDGQVLVSYRHEDRFSQVYAFAKIKAETSLFKDNTDGDEFSIINLPDIQVIKGCSGGLVLKHEGHVVGSIGVSGASPVEDKEIALAGVKKFEAIVSKTK